MQRDYVTEHQRKILMEDKRKNPQNIVTTQDIKAVVTPIMPCPQQLPQRFVHTTITNFHYYQKPSIALLTNKNNRISAITVQWLYAM